MNDWEIDEPEDVDIIANPLCCFEDGLLFDEI